MAEREWFDANRAMWDERVPIHVDSAFYDNESFLAGRSPIRAFEHDELGAVAGKQLVHLQCHFGQDTLDWARRGANVVGLDFSGEAVRAATDLARRAGLDAEFVEANVYDAVDALGRRRFDIVYTGIGALIWLPDLRRWADVVAELLEPGGTLYLVEFHPITHVFADDDLTVEHSYWHDEPMVWDDPGTYADMTAETTHNRSYEWNHGIGEVVSAVIDAGLHIDLLHEHDHTLMQRWPFLERDGDTWHMPAGMPTLPLMYSLRASASGVP